MRVVPDAPADTAPPWRHGMATRVTTPGGIVQIDHDLGETPAAAFVQSRGSTAAHLNGPPNASTISVAMTGYDGTPLGSGATVHVYWLVIP